MQSARRQCQTETGHSRRGIHCACVQPHIDTNSSSIFHLHAISCYRMLPTRLTATSNVRPSYRKAQSFPLNNLICRLQGVVTAPYTGYMLRVSPISLELASEPVPRLYYMYFCDVTILLLLCRIIG